MSLRTAALPFVLRREHGVVSGGQVTSTRDELHGLLHLDGQRLLVQWRTSREVSHVGREIRTDRELAPIREVSIPLDGIAEAGVRRVWRRWWFADVLVITAADLRAFEGLAGDHDAPGLVLEHPAEVVLELRRTDREQARNFASELRLAVSEHRLALLEEAHRHELAAHHKAPLASALQDADSEDLPQPSRQRGRTGSRP